MGYFGLAGLCWQAIELPALCHCYKVVGLSKGAAKSFFDLNVQFGNIAYGAKVGLKLRLACDW